jgi:hypothetical protein
LTILHGVEVEKAVPGIEIQTGDIAAVILLEVDLIPYRDNGPQFRRQALDNLGVGVFEQAIA